MFGVSGGKRFQRKLRLKAINLMDLVQHQIVFIIHGFAVMFEKERKICGSSDGRGLDLRSTDAGFEIRAGHLVEGSDIT